MLRIEIGNLAENSPTFRAGLMHSKRKSRSRVVVAPIQKEPGTRKTVQHLVKPGSAESQRLGKITATQVFGSTQIQDSKRQVADFWNLHFGIVNGTFWKAK